MRDADTVLGIIHERGTRGLPLEDIYRQLYNPHLYLRAYDRICRNDGALTAGVTGETVDGMSLKKIGEIIEQLRYERFRWTPVRRVYISKKNGDKRPLGMPTFTDKLVQEVMRQILEAYYEPGFSQNSHGFRPNRGCHTALGAIKTTWTGTRWFIEGDISKCFDKLDHDILMSILAENLHDNRFLRLISMMLKAGYLEDWKWHATYSGSPQGGVISPILSNIYLDRLDKFVEEELLPAYNREERRRDNPAYARIKAQISKARGQHDGALMRKLIIERRKLPQGDPKDPSYRRLHYVRYADDFLLGFIGPKAEAEEIKIELRDFLHETLKLDLSEAKTLITHAVDTPAHFLAYELWNQQRHDKLGPQGRRTVNGKLSLRIPPDVVAANCRKRMKDGKPTDRPELLQDSDYAIVSKYQAEFRGLVQYYALATNLHRLNGYQYVLQTSLLKTLAHKHKVSVRTMIRKLRATTETPSGARVCYRIVVPRGADKPPLVAEFGGLPLRRKDAGVICDTPYRIWTQRTDLITRLLADRCELCGARENCEVHHVKRLSNLQRYGRKEKPEWAKRMIAMRRKQLVVCHDCHMVITRSQRRHLRRKQNPESRVR